MEEGKRRSRNDDPAAAPELDVYVPDYTVFDLETTGLSTARDRIIEISAVRVRQGLPTAEYSTLVDPGTAIPREASSVNHITDEMVAGAPDIETALGGFLDFIGEDVLIGHNIRSFDLPLICRDSMACFGKLPGNAYEDTVLLSRRLLPHLVRHRLEDLCTWYGIPYENAHRGSTDCRMNQKAYEALMEEAAEIRSGSKTYVRLCPRCGKQLKYREGRFGPFLGCRAFPDCTYTENFRGDIHKGLQTDD